MAGPQLPWRSTACGRRQKNYPRPLQIALRLKHLAIFPRKVDFSCFGYHPYLESRLTIQEKWVLGNLDESGEEDQRDTRPRTEKKKKEGDWFSVAAILMGLMGFGLGYVAALISFIYALLSEL